jgi:nucleoside-diphosphate-sugar epimerase
MTARRILVTGADGCLGFPLANRLAQEGRMVVGLDVHDARPGTEFVKVRGDVRDVSLLAGLFAAHRFDAVVHCGGISGQLVASDDPYGTCEINVFGTVHLLEAARVHKVGRFVYASSQGAYGDSASRAMTEATPFLPVTVYGATKAACDLIVRAYAIQHGLNATSLRIGRVYGPGRGTPSVIGDMVRAAVAGRPLRLPSSGGRRLQYVYEADIVTALYLALAVESLPLQAYNVSGPGIHSDEEIAALVASLVPGTDITFGDAPLRDGSFPGAPMDYAAATTDFGYAPAYDMARGLADFIANSQSTHT